MRTTLIALFLLLAPVSTTAATFLVDRTLVVTEPPTENAYVSGATVRIDAPVSGDLAAAAGTLVILEEIMGDALLVGGTLELTAGVLGDVRAVGGHVSIKKDVKGDVVVGGGAISISGNVTEAHLAGGTVAMTGGAKGPVRIYGANVFLAGEFSHDVDVVASDHIDLAEGTVIRGKLRYNAPQEASIPASAQVGEVVYTGSSSFLPTVEEAKTFAVAGAGVFFVVSLISGLVAVGLLAGLFPAYSHAVSDKALFSGLRKFLLLFLLGFAIMVATPVLLLLLAVSVVGMGVGLLLGAAYLLLLMLAYLSAGILAGSALARGAFKRPIASWRFAMLGMLALELIAVVPGVGSLVVFVLSATAAGAIASLAFGLAFPRGEREIS